MSRKRRIRTGYRRQNLIDARLERGWSRLDLAKRLDTTSGVVEWWECGYSNPSEKNRLKLAEVFQLCNRLDDEYDIEEYIDAFLELVPVK